MLTNLFGPRTRKPPVEKTQAVTAELSSETFKDIFARLASSVAVVTFYTGRHLHGFTATSLTPVSMSPPLALFCVARKNDSHRYLGLGMPVGISMLAGHQSGLSTRFAGKAEPGGYADVLIAEKTPGVPVLQSALATLEGAVSEMIPAGDHTIYLCRLSGGALGAECDPLLYFARDYRKLGEAVTSTDSAIQAC